MGITNKISQSQWALTALCGKFHWDCDYEALRNSPIKVSLDVDIERYFRG